MNLNKVMLIGRLTRDPELRSTKDGRAVANFSIATNRHWTNDNGDKQEDTEFHKIVVWGRRAETAEKYLSRGDLVMVEGRLQTRKWETKDGDKRKTTEIVVNNIQFGPNENNKESGAKVVEGGLYGDEDDMPF